MKKYSITKYVKTNNIAKEEWTSVCDIGKMFNGIGLSLEEYKKVEDAYVDSILEIVKYMKLESFKIKDVYRWKDLRQEVHNNTKYQSLYSDSMLNIYENVTNNTIIKKGDLKNLIRLELREDIGGLLYVPYRLKIFIGYDYMMGVHSSVPLEKVFKCINNLGLYMYQFG